MPIDAPVSDYVSSGQLSPNSEEFKPNAGQVAVNTQTGQVAYNGKEITSMEPTLSDPDCW